MALVRVREKNPPEGARPQITYVDEAWIERWPDDFEIIPEPAPEPAPVADATDSGPADAPATDTPARGRF